MFQPGERVQTPIGNLATVQPSPWSMPHHTLIQVENGGAKMWILSTLLKPATAEALSPAAAPARRRGKRNG